MLNKETEPTNPRTAADIARENGAKSRGPVTPDGKARASLNSLRHGLTAETICLSNEASDRLKLTYQSYLDLIQPQNQIEDDLVQVLAVSKWQEQRSWAIETSLFNYQMDVQEEDLEKKFEKLNEPTRLAIAFKSLADDSHALQLLLRYRGAHTRQYDRALNQLMKLRTKDVFNNAPVESAATPPERPKPEQRNEPSPTPKPEANNDIPPTNNEQRATTNACCGLPTPEGLCAQGRKCDQAKRFRK
jgi:hypothetical protein